MTKHRPPFTQDAALDRIAGQIPGGKKAMAEIVGRQLRTVANWSDPDTAESVPFDCAVRLDLAYQEHGGQGAPLFETYAFQLELAQADKFARQFEIGLEAVELAREAGEATAAIFALSMPGAGPHEKTVALREAEELLQRLTPLIATISRDEAPP